MRKCFVKTENYRNFSTAIKAVEQRGAKEAGLVLVHGAPGYGKTHTVFNWAAEVGAIFLRANVDWTPKYALVELAKELKVDTRGTAQMLFARLLEPIARAQLPIVIDEAEFTLNNKAAALEKIRDISDRAEVTVVLIGMEKIEQNIASYKQISSRIARVVEFAPATLEDVRVACAGLSEVEMTPDLIAEVHRLSGGRMREVLNIIATIEQVAATNGMKRIDIADLEGIVLSHDWQNRTPRGGRTKKVA